MCAWWLHCGNAALTGCRQAHCGLGWGSPLDCCCTSMQAVHYAVMLLQIIMATYVQASVPVQEHQEHCQLQEAENNTSVTDTAKAVLQAEQHGSMACHAVCLCFLQNVVCILCRRCLRSLVSPARAGAGGGGAPASADHGCDAVSTQGAPRA